MPELTDPMNALVDLQPAIDRGDVTPMCGEIDPAIIVVLDSPLGQPRFTYGRMIDGKVAAISLFVPSEHYEGLPCFNVGYAVIEAKRQKGLATDIVQRGIDELKNGLTRNGIKQFWIEAVVGLDNTSSNKLAEKIFSDKKVKGVDSVSGVDVFQYLKLVK